MGRRSPDTKRTQAGFTLIELMIAMAVMAIGLLSIAVAQISATRISSSSKNLSQALYLAEQQMEFFRNLPWQPGPPWRADLFTAAVVDEEDFITPQPMPAYQGDPSPGTPDRDPNPAIYRRSWTITPGQPRAGLTEIVVTVSWDTPNGSRQSASLVGIKGPL